MFLINHTACIESIESEPTCLTPVACVEGGSLREMERSAWRSRTADCGPKQDEEDGFRKNLRGFGGRAEQVGEGSSLRFKYLA